MPNWGPSPHDNYPSEFSGVKGHHYSNPSTGYNGNNNYGNNNNPTQFEMEFDTKYSPSRGGAPVGGYHNNNNGRELSSQ